MFEGLGNIGLSKELTYKDVLLASIGNILGAGIYALLGKVAKYSQNMTWLSILIAGFISLLTSKSYIGLAKENEKNTSEHHIIKESFGGKTANFTMGLSIISGFFLLLVVSIGFGNYAESLLKVPSIICSIGLILVTAYINIVSIRKTANFNNIITIIEIIGLFIVVMVGIGNIKFADLITPPKNCNGIFIGAFLIIFAFFGYETLVRYIEETKDSKTIIPKAINNSLWFTMVLYLLVSMSAVSTVSWKKLAISKTPLSDVVAVLGYPWLFKLLSITAVFSTFNTYLMTLTSNSRIIYGLLKDTQIGKLLKLDYIGLQTRTPIGSIVFVTAMVTVLLLCHYGIETSSFIANFGVVFTMLLVNLSFYLSK